jgi:anti-anti-sigma regulatory factor
MTNSVVSGPGMHFVLNEKSQETIVYCSGQITSRSARWFEQEIRNRVIPISRGRGVVGTSRVMLDLSDVFHIDNDGLGSLFAVWTAGQQSSCDVEIHNLGSQSRPSALAQLAHRVISQIQGILRIG